MKLTIDHQTTEKSDQFMTYFIYLYQTVWTYLLYYIINKGGGANLGEWLQGDEAEVERR